MKQQLIGMMGACGLLFAACAENEFEQPPPPDEPAVPQTPHAPEAPDTDDELGTLEDDVRAIEEESRRMLVSEDQEVNLPEGIPVPENYVVLNESQVGPMSITTIEVADNLDLLVSLLNTELEGLEHDVEPIEREDTEEGRFQAVGRVMIDTTRVTITISEQEGVAMQDGTGTVTYQVTTLE